MGDDLKEQRGEWEQAIEYFTEYILHTIEDGKYDPENEDAPEFHPGTKRNLKSEIKKFISESFNSLDYTSKYGSALREALITVDRCHIRKMRIYRDNVRKMREMQKKIDSTPVLNKSIDDLLETYKSELEERYEDKIALGERNRVRANKQMERITHLNGVIEEYQQNYVPRTDYNELRDSYATDTLKAKKELAKALKKRRVREERAEVRSEENKERKRKEKQKQEKKMKEKKKKLEALTKELEEDQNKLDILTSSDSDSSDSDSDVETINYSIGSESD